MERIAFRLTGVEVKGIRPERADIIQTILKEINSERQGTKFKPMTPRLLAIKLSHINLQDLYYTHSICKDYKNRKGSYGKCLFGSIKPQ